MKPRQFLRRDEALARLRALPPDHSAWGGNLLGPSSEWASDRRAAFWVPGASDRRLAERLARRGDPAARVDSAAATEGLAEALSGDPPWVDFCAWDEERGALWFGLVRVPFAPLRLLVDVLGGWSALALWPDALAFYVDHHLRGAVYTGAGPAEIAARPRRVTLRDLLTGAVFEADAAATAAAAPDGLDPSQPIHLSPGRSGAPSVRYHHGPGAPAAEAAALVGALGLLVGRVALLGDGGGAGPARAYFVARARAEFGR